MRRRRWGREFVLMALAALAVLTLLEGVASLIIAGRYTAVWMRHDGITAVSERDTELGWRVRANLTARDVFAPGIGVTTSARGDRIVAGARPDSGDRLAVTCIGDSFTFGWGVADADTWCAQLAALEPRVSTTNLGQPGYGVDQMYLLARKTSPAREGGVMILAAIDDDLPRMLQNVESSQAKPQLTLRGGQLDLVRRPIKPWWRLTGRPRAALELAASRLALARLARGIANRVSPPDEAADVAGLRPVVAAVVTALRDHLASSQSRLIVVRLPGFARLEPFGSMFRDVTRDAGVPFVDLWEEFDRLSYVEADRLFIGPNHPAELTSNGHFSEAGGRTIAGWLLARGVLPLVR